MSDAAFDRPVDSLSYEDARDELVAIVAKLETGSATLEDSLTLWERGEALAARCQMLLDGALARVEGASDGVSDESADDEDADA
jgi:exodeoxyribonuclease VII small subunit